MRVTPAGWLRAALVAAVVATACASVFDLGISERVVDRAVSREHSEMASGALAVPEQFTRREQKGGLVLAELLYTLGIASIIAGVAILLGSTRSPARRWLLLSVVGGWSLVVMPAFVLPPLPPGATAAASIHERRATFVVAVMLGVLGCAGAAWVWGRSSARVRGVRALAAASVVVASIVVVVAVLPADRLVEPVDGGLIRDFRVVSLTSQALLWVACAAAGACILWRRQPSRFP